MSFDAIQLDALSQELGAAPELRGLDGARARAERRAHGAFFTPMPLVKFMVEEALDTWFAANELQWDPRGIPQIKILDPAAGDGRFLSCAAESLLRRLTAVCPSELAPGDSLARSIRHHVLVAIERDPEYARHIEQALGEGAVVHSSEALLSGVVPNRSVDIVIGNPPYLRSIQLGQVDEKLRSELRGVYAATSYREWDLYAAFLEQGLRWLRPNGQLAFVLPSRWWTAQWASPMRRELCQQGAIRALVDFGATQLFESATVYSSLCFASSKSASALRIARYQDGVWKTGGIGTSELGEGQPWNLALGKTRALLAKLLAKGSTLGEVARIAKGTGTNADSVFVIKDSATQIEPDLLRPLLRGRDVAAFSEAPPWPKLLLPYDLEGRLLSPETLANQFPKAWAYLLSKRAILEAREKGRFAGETFYCFGRPQNLVFHSRASAKVVVPDVTREGRALIDRQAAMVLDSAYAIRPSPGSGYDLECICAVLNSKLVGIWLAQHGLPLRGGYTRMKSAYLKGLPLPEKGAALDQLSESVRRGASPSEIDQQVRAAYGLTASEWQ